MPSKIIRFTLLCVVYLLPPTRFFNLKRYLLLRCGFLIGENVKFVSTARIFLPNLQVGNDTWIGHKVNFIGGEAAVKIGSNVDIGPEVMFATGTHIIGDVYRRAGPGYSLDIVVGDGCWLGARTTILGGVTIGAGSIIGAGSLVRTDIPPNSVAVGVPAKVIRQLAEAQIK